jgi:glycosyltransferase 2 family protein
VLFDRLSGVLALITICIVGYLALPDQPYEPVVIVAYVLALAGFLIVSSDRVIRLITASNISLVRKIGKVLISFRNYRRDPRTLLMIVLLSLAFQLNIVLINKVYTLALGLDIPLSVLLVIIPLIYLTEILPIAINGLGVRESAFAFFFVMIGHTVEEGLAVSLLVIGMRYALGLLGGTLLLITLISSRASRPSMAGRT